MSKMRCTIRTAFVGGMVLGLLFLQSAAVLVHHDCGHAHAVPASPESASAATVLSDVWHWCSHSGCDHAHDRSADDSAKSLTTSTSETPSTPTVPHDSDDCRICQTLFAARITASVVRCPDVAGYAIAVPDRHVPEVAATQPYRLPSRGPPA